MKQIDFFSEIGITAERVNLPTEMSDGMLQILGMPNFHCGPRAQLLRSAGVEIPTKAEAEQAFWIHLLLCAYLEWGESYWETLYDKIVVFVDSKR